MTRWKCSQCHDYDLCVVGVQQHVTCDVCSAESYLVTRWKCSQCHDYDLCVVGVQQRVTCDVCSAESYLGTRWKCSQCHDYDLCDICYHADRHDVSHEFRRFDMQTSEG